MEKKEEKKVNTNPHPVPKNLTKEELLARLKELNKEVPKE